MRQHLKWLAAAAALLVAASPGLAVQRDNPFTDVPKSHWAYSAVKDAVDAGILEGYDNKFTGNKTVTRYQMAQIVQRLMRRVGGRRVGDLVGDAKVTEQDLRNLEALTIEFADELALLNVKVSTLEDNVAGLKHDVEALKGSVPGSRTHKPEKRAGISGLVAVRGVMTDKGGPATGNGPFFVAAPAAGTGSGLTRYQGAVTGPATFKSRTFFTIPQLSLAFDREIDHGLRIHTQVDFDADISHSENAPGIFTESTLPSGNGNVQINEAWIESEDVVGGWGAKLGGFALPFSDEHNGRFRTLDWTITPSAQTARYEMYRPVGVELVNNDALFCWNLRGAVFTGLDNQNAALFWNEWFLNGSGINTPFTDVPFGIGNFANLGAQDESTGVGYYLRLGDHPNEGGLGWDINYMVNGSLNPTNTAGVLATDQEFQMLSGTLDYYWDWFALVAQYYTGVSKNSVAAGGAGRGIFALATDTNSTSYYVMGNYRWDPDNNFSLRYEMAQDETKAFNRLAVNTLTFCWNRIISDHSLLQVEYLNPDAKYTAPPGTASGTVDYNDMILQANYKLVF